MNPRFSRFQVILASLLAVGSLALLWLGSAVARTSAGAKPPEPLRASATGPADTARISALLRFQERKTSQYAFGQARQALAEALGIAERIRSADWTAKVYQALGYWADKQNNYPLALKHYEQALAYRNGSGQTDAIHRLYCLIGDTYQHALDPAHARAYYESVIRAQPSKASRLNQFYAYGGLANLADQAHDARRALAYNQKARIIARQLGRWDEYHNKLVNIAFNYNDLNQPRKAMALYKQCLEYADRIKRQHRPDPTFERHFITAIYDGLPYPLIALKRFDEAERYAKLALLHGRWDNGYQTLHPMWVYDALTLLYETKKDYASALAAHKQWARYRDSLQNQTRTQKFAELETRYQTSQKEARIRQLKAANVQRTRQLWAGVGGLMVLSALLGTMVWQYGRIRRSRTKIQQQSDQLGLMMNELHHRVKNNLAIVSSLLKLQSNRLDDQEAVQAVRVGQQRVEAMALIHQRLYQTNHVTTVDMYEYLTDLTQSLLLAYGHQPDDIDLRVEVEPQALDVDVAMPLGLIANELLTNAFKYAVGHGPAGQRPRLRIGLYNDGPVHTNPPRPGLRLEVQDNGPGLGGPGWEKFRPDRSGGPRSLPTGTLVVSPPVAKRASFGKRLIESLTEQLGGQAEWLNQNGTLFRLRIPPNRLPA